MTRSCGHSGIDNLVLWKRKPVGCSGERREFDDGVLEVVVTIGPFIRGKIRRVLHRTRLK